MRNATRHLAAGIAAAAAFCATPALAQTWAYASFTQSTTNADTYGNSYSQTQSGTTLTVTAFSNTGTGSTFATAAIGNYGSGSGFGVKNQSEGLNVATPQHSMDNYANTDMLALNFTSSSTAAAVSMVLTQLTTGWHNTSTSTGLSCDPKCTDSDISLLRYDGTGTPTIAGKTIAQLLSSGWSLVNDYSNMVDDTARSTGLTTSSTGSSWWLISAYNSAWGSCTAISGDTNCSSLSDGDDFVKVLSSVSAVPRNGTATPVPEPGTLAMAGLALAAACTTRRRPARAVAAA